jgi:thioredoxin reductase
MENVFYDVVILGASKEGVAVFKKLTKQLPDQKIVVISERLSVNMKDPIPFIQNKVLFTTYNHGLIGIIMEGDQGIPKTFCHKLIIASGQEPRRVFPKLGPNVQNLYYDTKEIPDNAKENQAIVVGNSPRAAKMALELKSKFKYVYLCTSDFDPTYHYQTKRKLDAAKNIAVLPGCQVVSWEGSKGQLQKVTLSTYATITCCGLYVDAGFTADLSAFPNARYRLFAVNDDGYIITDEDCRTIVPNVFAVGTVSTKYNLDKEKALVEALKKEYRK